MRPVPLTLKELDEEEPIAVGVVTLNTTKHLLPETAEEEGDHATVSILAAYDAVTSLDRC